MKPRKTALCFRCRQKLHAPWFCLGVKDHVVPCTAAADAVILVKDKCGSFFEEEKKCE
jgi:hypothetical protein